MRVIGNLSFVCCQLKVATDDRKWKIVKL